MASPGTVRLLSALWDGSLDEIQPTLDIEGGTITYPDANKYLDERDEEAYEVLEMLAERELLHREFQEKQYICPRCEAKGMRYTTACPSCESPQTIRTDRYRHPDCGYEGRREKFVSENGVVCPECRTMLDSLNRLDVDAANICEDCEAVFETPEHRLQCRECYRVAPPLQTIEQVLYRYYLSERGATWVNEQQTARQLVAEILEDRKLHTEIDTTVTDASGEDVPVHVYARDELLNDRVIATVHERPDESDINDIRSTAADVGARAMVVTTSGEIAGPRDQYDFSNSDVTVLRLTKNGTLEREFDVVDDVTVQHSFVGRIADMFKPQNG